MMTTISGFFSGDLAHALYWCAAAGGSLFFLLTLLLSGFDAPGADVTDGDLPGEMPVHVDTGFSDFQFLSIRSVLAFVTMFGWTGVVWGRSGLPGFLAALGIGLFAMFLTALVIWGLLKLQSSGTVRPEELVGLTGNVYLSIPAGKTEFGKVTVQLKGSTREVRAVAEETIPAGTAVRIESMPGEGLYLVRKI